MLEKAEFALVGDDDSGPEDAWMIWILSAEARHHCRKLSFNISLDFQQ